VLVLVLVLENTVPANRTRCLIHFRAGKEVLMGVARATQ
jgi:hypothetical protein